MSVVDTIEKEQWFVTAEAWSICREEARAQAPDNPKAFGGAPDTRSDRAREDQYTEGQVMEWAAGGYVGQPYSPNRNQWDTGEPDFWVGLLRVEVQSVNRGRNELLFRKRSRRAWPGSLVVPVAFSAPCGVPQTVDFWGYARGIEVVRFVDDNLEETMVREHWVRPDEDLHGLTRGQFTSLPGWQPLRMLREATDDN